MPYIEILTYDEQVIARIKHVLDDTIDIEEELMDAPTTSLTLPAEYYPICSQGLKKMKIHFNGLCFFGVIFGVDLDKEKETINVNLTHVIKMWDFRQVSTNKAIKDKKFYELYTDENNASDFVYEEGWTINFDETASDETIDYVYSRQGKLEALTQTCELTENCWWRVHLDKEKEIDIGVFGNDSGYYLSTKKANRANPKGIQILSEPSITEDYSSVINLATVYAEKGDTGVTSLSLREVYNDKSLQVDGFPVIIISNSINNEREYDYADYPEIAPNAQLEYAVMDTESIASESGVLREGSFAFDDLSPFATEDAIQNITTGSWIIPTEQRALTDEEYFNNCKCIYQFFTGLWSDQAIASFCGAIYVESRANPNCWQGYDQNYMPANLEGFGLVQWTPYTRITEWLEKRGYSLDQYGEGQCQKIKEEWSENSTSGPWIPTSTYNVTFKDWAKETGQSMEWMVMAYLVDYGRGVNSLVDQRVEMANQVLNYIQNDWSQNTSSDDSSSDDSGSSSSGVWKPTEFMNHWNGQSIDYDGAYGPQCVDLFDEFLAEIGEPVQYVGCAYELANLSFGMLEKTNSPVFGDWVIYGPDSYSSCGHVGMYVSGSPGSIETFGQNQGGASYCNTVVCTAPVYCYWHVKNEYWGEDSGGSDITVPSDSTTQTISNEDRIYCAQVAYKATIHKLMNARRTYQITVNTSKLPNDLYVGDKIKFFYDNKIYNLDQCNNYWKKILTLNNDFYVTKMTRSIDKNGNEMGSLTLEKFLRIDREVQKE